MPKILARAGVLLCIALVLSVSLRAGDWLGARFVQETVQHQRKQETVDFAEVKALYEGWKQAHKGSVARLMQYYAPQARIVREVGTIETFQQLKALAVLVRKEKTFDDVRDVQLPTLEAQGDKIVVKATQRYAHSSGKYQPALGNRKLFWQKIKGSWLIIEDDFPKAYTPTK